MLSIIDASAPWGIFSCNSIYEPVMKHFVKLVICTTHFIKVVKEEREAMLWYLLYLWKERKSCLTWDLVIYSYGLESALNVMVRYTFMGMGEG
jgi:hypothetical protein